MQEEQTRDISDIINDIIDKLLPLYEEKIEEGPDSVIDFVVSIFGAVTKLCGEINIGRDEAELMFHRMWNVMEENKKRDLN